MQQLTILAIIEIFAIAAGASLIAEVVIRWLARALRRAGASPYLARTVRDVLTVIWVVLAASAILVVTGVASEFSFLTVGGIVGLAVSLALQNTLSNVISGFLLVTDGVIRLNDSVAYSGVKGVVVKIGLRNTWVKTETGEVAIMSNSSLAYGPLVNYSAADRLEHKLRV